MKTPRFTHTHTLIGHIGFVAYMNTHKCSYLLSCVCTCVCVSYAFVYKQQLYLQVNNTKYTFSQREKQQNKNKTNKAKEPHTTQTFVPFHRLLVFLHRDMRLPGSSCPSALYHLTLRVKCSLCFFSLFFSSSSLIHTKIISRKLGWVQVDSMCVVLNFGFVSFLPKHNSPRFSRRPTTNHNDEIGIRFLHYWHIFLVGLYVQIPCVCVRAPEKRGKKHMAHF